MRRVGEREVLQRAEAGRLHPTRRPSAGVAGVPPRPFAGVARPPGVRVVLVVARDLGAGREPRLADQHRHVRRASPCSASTASRSGSTAHSSCSSRASAPAGSSPASTAPPAPSAHTPGPARDPLGAPAGEPATVVVAHDAQHRERARGVVRSAAAPSASPRARAEPAVGHLEAGEPGGHAVVRRRAAAGQLGDRPVGGLGLSPAWARSALAPARRHPVGRPGTAREDSGRIRTSSPEPSRVPRAYERRSLRQEHAVHLQGPGPPQPYVPLRRHGHRGRRWSYFDIERLGWEEGDQIAGLTIVGDAKGASPTASA